MQCPNMNHILTIDKKKIIMNKADFVYSHDKTLRKIANMIQREGTGRWDADVELFFHDRKWTYFNRKPAERKKEYFQWYLWKQGYYKENKVGCGTCEICQADKSKQWSVKATCEYKTWDTACFLTLTYNDQNLAVNNGYINKANMTTFWKNLRYHLYKNTKKAKKIDLKEEYENMKEIPEEVKLKYMLSKRKPKDKPIRYIQCHEYGTKKGRAHAHAVIFNFKPTDLRRHSRDRRGYFLYTSKKLNKLWGHGYVIIGNVNANVAAYVARYNTKKFSNVSGEVNTMYKQLKEAYENAVGEAKIIAKENLDIWKRRKESISASSLGYIGSYYWETNKEKIIDDAGIFVNWAKGVRLEKIPKPMEKDYEKEFPYEYEIYQFEKEERGQKEWEKILSQQSLTEEEYIKNSARQRIRSMKLLQREYAEKPTTQTIFQNT